MQAKCTYLKYTSTSKSLYTIICPYDYTVTSPSPGVAGKGLEFTYWKFPSNFGKNNPLGNTLRFIWSGADGNLLMYKADNNLGNAVDKECTVSN